MKLVYWYISMLYFRNNYLHVTHIIKYFVMIGFSASILTVKKSGNLAFGVWPQC